MRVLTLNTNNSAGGATKACLRLHKNLVESGVASDLLMLESPPSDIPAGHNYYSFYLQQTLKQKNSTPLVNKAFKKLLYELGQDEEAKFNKLVANESRLLKEKHIGSETMHFASSRYRLHEHPLVKQADVVHLHCIINGFLDYYSFFSSVNKPLIWTLHDMTPFTGGCVYSEGCEGFTKDCDTCPQLKGTSNPNYASKTLDVKRTALKRVENLVVVSPSRWLLNHSRNSNLFGRFKHEHIPYGIDSGIFQPRDKEYSKSVLGIPLDKPVILFVSHHIHNQRKGYQQLLQAFNRLNLSEKVTLCAVGSRSSINAENGVVELGSITDERLMSIAYSAADAFVIPSLEDNLPNTVIESLLCGTPVIGFPVGGIPEMVEHDKNGIVCEATTVEALANAISAFLETPNVFSRMRIREDALTKYDSEVQRRAYVNLYNRLIMN